MRNIANGVKQIRDRAMLALISNGMSTGQIAALDVDQIDLRAGTVSALSPRARKRVDIELMDEVVIVLAQWMSARALLRPETMAAFITMNTNGACEAGSRIGAHSIRCALRSLNGRAGRV